MPRYQFEPRAHIDQVDIKRAKTMANTFDARRVRECYPTMYKANQYSQIPGAAWRGTNQPRTVSFTVASDDIARRVATSYGLGDVFVWNLTDRHYV